MTLDELKSLRQGEVVVFTKVDERICEYHNHQIGDEMTFVEIESGPPNQSYHNIGSSGDVVNFLRNSYTISHFSYEICHYIESKTKLRDNKLNSIGI
jgi:hypothetical protein